MEDDSSSVKYNNSVAYEIKSIWHIIQRKMFASASQAGVDQKTFMQCWIIGYIETNKDKILYQKDIENKFSLTSSAVTHILKSMEKKGYIVRMSVENDARLKKIVVTEDGKQLHKKIASQVLKNEKEINGILSIDDTEQLICLLKKLKKGLKNNKGDKNDKNTF